MATLETDERFETNLAAYTVVGAPTVAAAASLDTANGSKGLLINTAGIQSVAKTLAAGRTVEVGRILARIPTGGTPATAAGVIAQIASATGLTFQIRASTGRVLQGSITGSTVQTGPTMTVDQIYRIDYRFSCAGTTYTIDWSVDGVAQTQVTIAGQTASTFSTGSRKVGNTNSGTTAIAMHLDAWATSATTGDYPLGAPSLLARLKRGRLAIRLGIGL